MHEVRVTAPVELSLPIAQIAIAAGIPNVSVCEIFVHGAECRKHVVSVEVSTPQAKVFIDSLLSSAVFNIEECSVSSRELRAIIGNHSLEEITQPMMEPAPDVIEDLWQMSHVTPGYVARATGGAILLADGVIHNDAIAIVVAALFLPFLSQVLALGFGTWCGDGGLVRKGGLALLTSAVLAFSGGLVVALLAGGPIAFHNFRGPLPSFAISAIIGAAAGLSTADDAGRRYLIGVAAAVQFAVFPAWLGAACIIGLPAPAVLGLRIETFLINVFTIAGAAVAAYSLLGLKREELRSMLRHAPSAQTTNARP
ncbi:MAG: hypothetical protein M3N93_00740 [Acidobacteriota bacterium]|nr:hypothetical protein [Acidobacteriota bacterium]